VEMAGAGHMSLGAEAVADDVSNLVNARHRERDSGRLREKSAVERDGSDSMNT
jgi:hypothetical protein